MELGSIYIGLAWEPIVEIIDVQGATPAVPEEITFTLRQTLTGPVVFQCLLSDGTITMGTVTDGDPLVIVIFLTSLQTATLTDSTMIASLTITVDGVEYEVDPKTPVRVIENAS